jgi:hypothetical protein
MLIYWEKNTNTMKKNKKALLQANKEVRVEVNTEKTKHLVESHYQNVGLNHNLLIVKQSSENVAEFEYLGTTVTNQNFIHKEIMSRLNSVNAW